MCDYCDPILEVFFVISFVEPTPSVFMTIWAIFTQADDEHSDWPGPEPGLSVMQLTDEEIDPEISFSQAFSLFEILIIIILLKISHSDHLANFFYFTATCRPTSKEIPGKAGSLWYEAVEKSGNCR